MAVTLSAIVPVLGMLILGMAVRKYRVLSREGIDNIKFLVSRIMLPAAIFHALATADYGGNTFYMIIVMLLLDVGTFLLGFVCRGLLPKPERKYLPYLVSLYEGGMLAYPLFMNLVGSEHLSSIALIDISGLLFGFSIYMGMLQQMENQETISAKALFRSALHSPAFIATVLGVLAGLSGIINHLLELPAGSVYLSMESMITTPLNALILLAVGYDLSPSMEDLSKVLRAISIRLVIQIVACAIALFTISFLFPEDSIMKIAAIMYMCVPTTFSMQTYVRDEDGSRYVATVNSLYCIITVIVYIATAFLYQNHIWL